MNERGNQFLRYLDRFLGIPLVNILGLRTRKGVLASKKRLKIAILSPGAIGDILLTTSLINAIKNKFPSSLIDIAASKANAAAIPLLPNVNEGLVFAVSQPLKIIWKLREREYDLLFDTSQWSRLGALISYFSGASYIVGFNTRGQYRSKVYDKVVEHDYTVHEMENFLNLGKAIWPDLRGKPSLNFSDAPVENKKGIFCHMWPAPGRGRNLKEWPAQYWASLISRLLKYDEKIYLTGSAADREEAEDFIKNYFPDNPVVIDLCGRTSLVELAQLFKQGRILISVNTGIMHLGALSGIPTIALHGPTNPMRWGPVGTRTISLLPESGACAYLNLGFEYPSNAVNNLIKLKPQTVIKAAEKFLSI